MKDRFAGLRRRSIQGVGVIALCIGSQKIMLKRVCCWTMCGLVEGFMFYRMLTNRSSRFLSA